MGDKVWLSTKDLPMKGRCRKLEARRLGPFEVVEQINPVSFKLILPASMKIYSVFHRALLSLYVPAHHYQEPRQAPPPTIMVEDQEEFVI